MTQFAAPCRVLKLPCGLDESRARPGRGKALAHDGRIALLTGRVSAALLASVLASALPIGRGAWAEPATAVEAPSHAAGVELTIRRGGTLLGTLLRARVDRRQAYAAVAALEDFFDPRDLRGGDRVWIQLGGDTPAGQHRLRSLHVATARHQDLTIVAQGDGNFAPPSPARHEWSLAVYSRSGDVGTDLRASLAAATLPAPVIDEAIIAFTYDPDLPADPAPGSRFTVVYEALEGPGIDADEARLRYASLQSDGTEHRVYRYPMNGGDVAFVEPSGRGVVPLRLAQPVGDAGITSPWGWRIHPVLGVRKFHRGVDFGAPTGTPVHAAADGAFETMGWRGNYGRYIRLRHSERVETAYAHLSRFVKGLHPGSVVRRGQVIAYVGASGLATGPHLYYEVLVDGRQVDPEQDLVVPIQLAGNSFTRFKSYLEKVAAAVAPR